MRKIAYIATILLLLPAQTPILPGFPPGLFSKLPSSTIPSSCTPTTIPGGGLYTSLDLSDSWASSGIASLNINAVFSPACATTGATIIADSTTSNHSVNKIFAAVVSAAPHTYSVYLKRVVGTLNSFIQATGAAFGNNASVGVDLGTCTVDVAAAVSGTWSAPSATAVLQSNGWCKVSLTATAAADTFGQTLIYTQSGTTLFYTGNSTDSIGAWGVDFR